MIPRSVLKQIVELAYRFDDLRGCIIGAHANLRSEVIEFGIPNSPNYGKIIIIEEVEVIADADLPQESFENKDLPQSDTNRILNKSVAGSELLGTGLSCGLAIISGIGFVTSLLAEGPSLGTSTGGVILSWGGMISGGASCLNGIIRSVEAHNHPNENSLQRWDDKSWYQILTAGIDIVGIVSSGYSIYKSAIKTRAILQARKLLTEDAILRTMSAEERASTINEALRKLKTDKVAKMELETMALDVMKHDKGMASKVFMEVYEYNLRIATSIVNSISKETATALSKELTSILLSMAGIGLSATPKEETGSASGVVNLFLVHIL